MTFIKNGLYAITDCDNLDQQTLLKRSEEILNHGVSLFQYRNKNRIKYVDTAKALQALCKEFNTPFIINDDTELAYQIKADGVHLGKDDYSIEQAREYLGPVIIGKSCYNELSRAILNDHIDYAAFGAFYPSETKPNAVKPDISILGKAKKELTIPVVAIGGITPNNGKPLLKAGANILAVITALFQSDDIKTTMDEFSKLFKG